mmetsp:Transcript_84158/g.238796  ORF Transcript_84158/g.238796 Transcript_84158/m.238796 type:complete len:283 (+) Transcript_84158:425-1273(+)
MPVRADAGHRVVVADQLGLAAVAVELPDLEFSPPAAGDRAARGPVHGEAPHGGRVALRHVQGGPAAAEVPGDEGALVGATHRAPGGPVHCHAADRPELVAQQLELGAPQVPEARLPPAVGRDRALRAPVGDEGVHAGPVAAQPRRGRALGREAGAPAEHRPVRAAGEGLGGAPVHRQAEHAAPALVHRLQARRLAQAPEPQRAVGRAGERQARGPVHGDAQHDAGVAPELGQVLAAVQVPEPQGRVIAAGEREVPPRVRAGAHPLAGGVLLVAELWLVAGLA